MIADEPTTALDVTIQAQILDLIKLLQNDIGMSVMFITHDMGVVAEVADRVVVMLKGKKVEEGPAEQVFHDPQHPYTKALLAAVPRLGSMTGMKNPAKFANVDVNRSEGEAVTTGTAEQELIEVESTVRTEEPPLLTVEGLTTRFDIRKGLFGRTTGRVHAVEGISFSLQPGETLALVGESGCGKSTTGRSIIKLVEPTRGSVVFEGERADGSRPEGDAPAPPRHADDLPGPVRFAEPAYDSRLPIIAEPMIVHGIAKGRDAEERVIQLLRRVGLDAELAGRYPHEFSGGQRQRLGIARALGLSPKPIIADEAVSALDVSIQAQVVNLMMDLQEEFGLSYLFISHDMAVVERVSHRIAVMYLGQIVEIGPRQAVHAVENPQHPYTKLMSAVPVADPRLRKTDLNLMTDEIPSPLKPVGYEPEDVAMIEVEPGHFVLPYDKFKVAA